MNVTVLQQFLQSLVKPLKACEASQQIVDDIERLLYGLKAFADKPVAELAEFLGRCQHYEKNGQWPQTSPPIAGNVVDKAAPEQFAQRLKKFLETHVPSTGPMSPSVPTEIDALKSVLNAAQLKEMAKACGVNGTIQNGPKAIEKAFEHLTGRKLPDALIEMRHRLILDTADDIDKLDQELKEVEKLFNITQIRKLAKQFDIQGTVRSKSDGIAKIRVHVSTQQTEASSSNELFEEPVEKTHVSGDKINRIVERLRALKDKADPESAPYEEIEDELQQIEAELTPEEAIAAAKSFGIERSIYSKSESIRRIHGRVFERKLIREKLQY